jgi:hypothetical protein
MSYYSELRELYMEKIAGPGTVHAVQSLMNERKALGIGRPQQAGVDLWNKDGQRFLPNSSTIQPAIKANPQQSVRPTATNNAQTVAPAIQPAISVSPKRREQDKIFRAQRLGREQQVPSTQLQPAAKQTSAVQPAVSQASAIQPVMRPNPEQAAEAKAARANRLRRESETINNAPAPATTQTQPSGVQPAVKVDPERAAEAKARRANDLRAEVPQSGNTTTATANTTVATADTPNSNTQDQSFFAAVKGNRPKGEQTQTITPETSVFANPNNQSNVGSRVLSWAKDNPKKAIAGTAAATAGTLAAAYGIHKMIQAKKEKREDEERRKKQVIIRTASSNLEELYMEKLAATEVPDASESIPRGVQDDASMIEKIQEAIKYTKKEDVPGGKSAPSKLVQRKNKERFKK